MIDYATLVKGNGAPQGIFIYTRYIKNLNKFICCF